MATHWTSGNEIPELEVPSFNKIHKPLGWREGQALPVYNTVSDAVDALDQGTETCPEGITSVYSMKAPTDTTRKHYILYRDRADKKNEATQAIEDAKAETLMYKGRFAAHMHNNVRYNKLSLLKHVNVHVYNRLVSEMSGQFGAYLYLKLAISLVCLCALPKAYSYYDSTNTTHPLVDAKMCGTILVSVVTALVIVQWRLGSLMLKRQTQVRPTGTGGVEQIHITSLDVSSNTYWYAFWVYYGIFKFWQSWVIKPMMPGLMYGNLAFWESRFMPHTGVYVVGYAVNIVQAILICYTVFMFTAESLDWTWLTVTAAGILALSFYGLEFLFGPSDVVKQEIDFALKQSECNEIFERMENFTTFAVTVEELHLLQRTLDTEHKFRTYPPGSTHALTILLDVGTHYGEQRPRLERFDVSKPISLQ
jgi:hypothetical protein